MYSLRWRRYDNYVVSSDNYGSKTLGLAFRRDLFRRIK
jgi:hypothetical protein